MSFKAGDKVVFKNGRLHNQLPNYYPPAGTIGTVLYVCKYSPLPIQWPIGSTSMRDVWWCDLKDITKKRGGY